MDSATSCVTLRNFLPDVFQICSLKYSQHDTWLVGIYIGLEFPRDRTAFDYSFFTSFFIILLYWEYIVTFTKVLKIYFSWVHPLHHSLLFPHLPFLELFLQPAQHPTGSPNSVSEETDASPPSGEEARLLAELGCQTGQLHSALLLGVLSTSSLARKK
jgi:hypothetical protein